MTSNDSLYFNRINVEGYRGRNFELEMNPLGDHSIFVMGGNTGKTTLIELLRWCFNYPQSKAEGKFRHMFTEPAHILDWNYPNEEQICKIEVDFSKNGHDYLLKRVTEGKFSWEEADKGKTGDVISKIEDTVEVDRGDEVYQGGDAHTLLVELGISPSADYFLFDGERAREYMLYASDTSKVQDLIDAVNRRVIPRRLSTYLRKLNEVEEKVYDKLGSKATDKGISRALNELRGIKRNIQEAKTNRNTLEDEIRTHKRKIRQLKGDIGELNKKITETKSRNLEDVHETKGEIKDIKEKIDEDRGSLYENSLKAISYVFGDEDIDEIKKKIRERGRLPEPYRKDLIELCLESDPPNCHICGKELDEESENRIKQLGEQIAPHNVQAFLSSDVFYDSTSLDLNGKYERIEGLLEKLGERKEHLEKVKLSDEEENLIKERDKKDGLKDDLIRDLGDLEGEHAACLDAIKNLEADRGKKKEKSELLQEYRIVIDEIEKAQNAIEETKERIKNDTIGVISDAIGRSVGNILGSRFSAKLKEDSLLLGEDDVFHPEVGGMSGKLVLSYCFAESMTRVDPLIIDTPVGNIDQRQREKLAKHLKANHQQLVLLCLPTELDYFADELSDKKIEILNREDDVTWLKN